MRQSVFRVISLLLRALRPARRRRLQPLLPGGVVLYLQYETPLGCCVHGTPLIEALRACAPDVRVIVATRSTGAATLAHHPAVEHLLDSKENPFASARNLWRTAATIRHWLRQLQLRPDWIVSDASGRRPGSAVLGALLRLAPTVGFSEAAALHDLPLRYDPDLSLIDNNLRLAQALGGSLSPREPAVFFSAAELMRARKLLPLLDFPARGLIALVMQGSGGQRTGWHDGRFAEVIRRLEADGCQTVFLGTSADAEGIDRVRVLASSSGRSLAGETTIAGAAAVLCRCDLLISVDTGTMHVGRAVGVPMVVLGPSWQRPLEWLPLGLANVRILRGPDRSEAPADYRLDEVEVEGVLAAAYDLLSRFPPGETARQARVGLRLSETRT